MDFLNLLANLSPWVIVIEYVIFLIIINIKRKMFSKRVMIFCNIALIFLICLNIFDAIR